MKKTLFILGVVCFFVNVSFGQSADPQPGTAIPSFNMQLSDGSNYSSKQIPKNKPLVLIYFAPDCEHCIKLMDELFKKIHQLDQATIVMITFEQPKDVAWFERKYRTATYPHIKVGTEGTSYVLRKYYRLDKTPFTAVYNKSGKLAFSYKNETPVSEMLARYKKL
ncbi:MAG: redoxin domain-containing protein [Bacteroidota bacterium]|nr:redoxin domain-containing protein [Bacteroidota bacterium]